MDTAGIALEVLPCTGGPRASDGSPSRAMPVAPASIPDAVRLAGLRRKLHPNDAIAFIYPDREYFADSQRREREFHHNTLHGPFETPWGLLGIVDLTSQYRTDGREDDTWAPSAPDDCRNRSRKPGQPWHYAASASETPIGPHRSEFVRQPR